MQANEAGIALKEIFDTEGFNKDKTLMYHSPFARASGTCYIINASLQIPKENIMEDNMLMERSYGEYSEIPYSIREEWKTAKKQTPAGLSYGLDYFYTRAVGGESAVDAEVRLRIFFEMMYREAQERKAEAVVLVCHGSLMSILLKWYLHKDIRWYKDFYMNSFPKNGSIHLIENGKYFGEIYTPPEDLE